MSEKPIIMCGESVCGIFAGRKRQTRRVMKPQPKDVPNHRPFTDVGYDRIYWGGAIWGTAIFSQVARKKARYAVGDILWVRETFSLAVGFHEPMLAVTYMADKGIRLLCMKEFPPAFRHMRLGTHPSIHMPRCLARLWLRVLKVRCERLQEISEEDAKAEGLVPENAECNCPGGAYQNAFCGLWDRLNAKRGHSWDSNPWVFVYEFERIDRWPETKTS